MSRVFRIHPGIGIARVGDAPADQYFIGPEAAGAPGTNADGSAIEWYKVPSGSDEWSLIRPQAARFRLWEYERIGSTLRPVREVELGKHGVTEIVWKVHLANKKAAHFWLEKYTRRATRTPLNRRGGTWVIDPGSRMIKASTRGQAQVEVARGNSPSSAVWPKRPDGSYPISYLGTLTTDADGRLLVIGGRGASGHAEQQTITEGDQPASPLSNPKWFDDVSDGPVTCTVTVNGEEVEVTSANAAWVVVAPPDFAPEMTSMVTLYDVLVDRVVRTMKIPPGHAIFDMPPLAEVKAMKASLKPGTRAGDLGSYRVSVARQIQPLLQRAVDSGWAFGGARGKHGTLQMAMSSKDRGVRRAVFRQLRRPTGWLKSASQARTPTLMPTLNGDTHKEFLTLTRIQYALLLQWARGFDAKIGPPPKRPPAPSPFELDRAALESCSGGAFAPGLDVSSEILDPSIFAEPFRLDHGRLVPGQLTRALVVPWHSDFAACARENTAAEPKPVGAQPAEHAWQVKVGWWPSQRPDDVVYRDSHTGRDTVGRWFRTDGDPARGVAPKSLHRYAEFMRLRWSRFGFLRRDGARFVEDERDDTGTK